MSVRDEFRAKQSGGSRNGAAAVSKEEVAKIAAAFLTPAELRGETPPETAWLWEGYIALDEVAEVAGKPKVGKSTIVFALVEAMVTGAETFLDRSITQGAVVYVSEEAPSTLLHKLPPDGAPLYTLPRNAIHPRPSWPALIEGGVCKAREVGAVLLVIDTGAFWAGLPAEASKDDGAVHQVMQYVSAAASETLAVLVILHQRKSGGEGTDAVSGSNAWTADADMVIELERIESASETQRLLLVSGRHDPLPAPMLIERDLAGYRAVGSTSGRREAAASAMRDRVLSSMPDKPPGITEADLATLLCVDKRKIDLRALVDEGVADRGGDGKEGRSVPVLEGVPRKGVPAVRTQRTQKLRSLVSVSGPRRGTETRTESTGPFLSRSGTGGQKEATPTPNQEEAA